MKLVARSVTVVTHAAIVVAIVVVLTFALVRIVPGDPVSAIAGARGSEEARAALRAQLRLDQPVGAQFTSYLSDLVRADLGRSLLQQGRGVNEIVGETLPVTAAVVAATMVWSGLTGVALGTWAALTGRRGVDFTVRWIMASLLALPPFFVGVLLLWGPGGSWEWLPAGGWGDGWPSNLPYLVLPVTALSCYLLPLVVRTVRQAALETAREPFVDAAIMRGLTSRRVAWRHVLPNSVLPVIALLAINAGSLVAGAVVVEAVFAIPGIGRELVVAVARRDYPVVQGIALVSALCVVACNLLGDLTGLAIDPRTRR